MIVDAEFPGGELNTHLEANMNIRHASERL